MSHNSSSSARHPSNQTAWWRRSSFLCVLAGGLPSQFARLGPLPAFLTFPWLLAEGLPRPVFILRLWNPFNKSSSLLPNATLSSSHPARHVIAEMHAPSSLLPDPVRPVRPRVLLGSAPAFPWATGEFLFSFSCFSCFSCRLGIVTDVFETDLEVTAAEVS